MIFRRARLGDWIEALEIELSDEVAGHGIGATSGGHGYARVTYVGEEGDWLLYEVTLPDYLRVRPAKLGKFAADPDEVSRLVATCMKDNVSLLVHELSLEAIEGALVTALQDLSAVMELDRVECRRQSDGALSTSVVYRIITGEVRMLTTECEF